MQVVATTGLLELQVVQSSSQIITTNKPTSSFFTGQIGCPSCRPSNSVKALKGKYHIPWTCLPQAHLRVFQLLSLTTNSSWGIRNIRSQDYSFPGTFVPMMELSFSGPFVPWNFRSRDRSFPGTFAPWTIRSLELSFPGPFQGTYVPGKNGPRERKFHHGFQGTNSLGNEYSSIRSWFPWGGLPCAHLPSDASTPPEC